MIRSRICLLSFFCCIALFVNAADLDSYLSSMGLVNVLKMDTSIHLSLKYASSENLMGEAVYHGMTGAWLHKDAAIKLIKAQKILKEKHPELSLIIYDAARPLSVQRKMWNLVHGTNKTNYVSNPAKGGGLHNYGLAVDVTIVDQKGIPLSMGSSFDHLGEASHTTNEKQLLQSGKITKEEYNNRQLLRSVMKEAGFRSIPYEWWHFNACSRAEAKANYSVID